MPAAGAVDGGRSVVVARLAAETDYPRGTPVSLVFDAQKLHFFDVGTGLAL